MKLTRIFGVHLGAFVSGVVVGLRRHMTRSGHVTGAMSTTEK